MNFINLTCPSLPYYVVGGECIFRPGDIHERRIIHNVFDFIYVHSGHLYLEQDSFRADLSAGQFFIILPDSLHKGSRVCTEKTVTSWIHFYTSGSYELSEDFVSDCITRRATPKYYYSPQPFTLSLPRTGAIPESDRPKVEKYLQQLTLVSFSKYTQKKDFPASVRSPFELQTDFIEFLQILYAPLCHTYGKESIAKTIRDYFHYHYMENISLNQLAKQYSYSPSHLIRCFNQTYHLSPMQYLKKLRVEKASQLLLNSDDTIQEIGEKVGLQIPSYFIRQFKKETGFTPSQYRSLYSFETQTEDHKKEEGGQEPIKKIP